MSDEPRPGDGCVPGYPPIPPIEQLNREHVKAGGDHSYRDLGNKYGIPYDRMRGWIRSFRKKNPENSQYVDNRTTWTEQTNTAVATGRFHGQIMTAEELLEAVNCDMGVWRVDHKLYNKWPVGAKAREQELTWTAGVMDGYSNQHGLAVADLLQIKLWMVRIDPIAIHPTINPIECAVEIPGIREPRTDGIGRALILPDPHFGYSRDCRTDELTPYHNEAALDVTVQMAAMQPDKIIIPGDIFDLAEWSDKFLKAPEFRRTTQPAIVAGHTWLLRIRTVAPNAEIVLVEGNHGKRMRDAVIVHLKAAYDLRPADQLDAPPALSIPSLLALDKLQIEWVGGYPDAETWINDGLRVNHGQIARGNPGDTAKAVVDQADVSESFGHIHRIERATKTVHTRDGQREVTAFSPGCLCWCDGRVPGYKARQQWQNGMAVVDYEIGGDRFTPTLVPIIDGKAIFEGSLFEG